ncbi:hypothetical protein ACFL0M_01790 [Thermodesulfobacteriota bacterium]
MTAILEHILIRVNPEFVWVLSAKTKSATGWTHAIAIPTGPGTSVRRTFGHAVYLPTQAQRHAAGTAPASRMMYVCATSLTGGRNVQ